MKTHTEIQDQLNEVLDDERLGYDDADVEVNAPLALIQTSLKTKRDMLKWVLDGDDAHLRFANEYVQPVLDRAKTATVRVHGELFRAGERVPALTEDGTQFATLEVTRSAEVMAVEAVDLIQTFGAEHAADTPNELIDQLGEHYEQGVRPSTTVQVIVFDVVNEQ